MNNIFEIANELKSTSGKLAKESILKREINNEKFKQFIKQTMCPMKIYGIQQKKLNKYLGKTDASTEFDNLFEVFSYLESNPTGRDIDAEKVAKFIDSQSDEYKDFLVESFCKKLRLGVDSTINKVYGKGFIHEFKVMLAKDFYKESHKVEGKEFVLTEKIDGMRAIIIYRDDEVKIFSRSGQPVLGLTEIENEIKQLPQNTVLDGELLIKNEHSYKDRDVLQETLKITRKDGEKKGVNFWAFDSLSYDEFQDGKSKELYQDRRIWLENTVVDKYEHIHTLPVLYGGSDMSVIPELLSELEVEGKEGLMLNTNQPYFCKRSDVLLKIKSMKSFDEICLGVFEGEGKYKGMLGGINVLYKGYPLKVGSGFSDEQRKLYWDNPELIVNSVVEIQYFRESSNADGGLSVSFPVFKMKRDDKTDTSYH